MAAGGQLAGDSREVTIGKRLIDVAKRQGFEFRRSGLGPDAPLIGTRTTENWVDEIHLAGFSSGCCAVRRHRTSLLVPGEALVAERVRGGALQVLNIVVSSWSP